jgi:glycosyltransferase involved in cell wall biosynthesis
LTVANDVGGHTRLAWRWIAADHGRRSSVALTGQGWHGIPQPLSEAVARSGGRVTDLSRSVGGFASRARRLRRLMAGSDVVVLHIHPYDVVPLLALESWEARPPVIFVNHADHVFWLGTSVTDLLVNIRQSGLDLAAGRRGIDPDRSSILPISIDPPTGAVSREDARRALGIAPEAVVALSVAAAYKFEPAGGLDFVETLLPVLHQVPELVVMAVGPPDEGRWAAAAAHSGGRLRALGVRSDLDLLYAAADLYLDSLPIGSLTSLLEAGGRGIPLVTLRGDGAGMEILSVDLPGLEDIVVATADADGYGAAVARLASDREAREERGRRTGQAILATSTGAGWLASLDSACARAAELRRNPRPLLGPIAAHPSDLDRRLAELRLPGAGLAGAIAAQIRFAPPRRRATMALDAWRGGRRPGITALIPDWVRVRLRRVVGNRRGFVRRFIASRSAWRPR